MEKSPSILIVDDHSIVSEGIVSLLGTHGMENCTHVTTAPAAIENVSHQQTGIAIVDLELREGDGLDLIRQIRAVRPSIRILIYTMHEELWALRDIEAALPEGVVFKSEGPLSLVEGVKAVADGHVYHSPLYQKLLAGNRPSDLGYSAQRILGLLAAGLSSKEIAEKVFLSENTIEYHRKRMMRFFNASNTAQMILQATKLGYIRP